MIIKNSLKYIFMSILVIVIGCKSRSVIDYTFQTKLTHWYYTFSLANIHNDEAIAGRYANVIEKESTRGSIPSELVARQNWVESRFRWYRSSKVWCKKTGEKIDFAVGSMGVVTKHWAHLLYTDDNKSLRKYLNKQKLKCLDWSDEDRLTYMYNLHNKYFKRIGYNIYAGVQIDRWNLNRYDGDYIKALTSYWAGPYSDELKDLIHKNITNEYPIIIYYPEEFDKKMEKNQEKFGYTWNRDATYNEMTELYVKYHPDLFTKQ